MYKVVFAFDYDHDHGQRLFEDFVNGNDGRPVIFENRRRVNQCVIFQNEETCYEPMFTTSALRRMTRGTLLDLFYRIGLGDRELDEYRKADLIEALGEVSKHYFYKTLCESDDGLAEFYSFTLRGYSSSDICKVAVVGDPAFVASFEAGQPARDELFDLFYNAPLYGYVTLSEIDPDCVVLTDSALNEVWTLYADECLSDLYRYNKGEILDAVANNIPDNADHKDKVLEYLAVMLPEDM